MTFGGSAVRYRSRLGPRDRRLPTFRCIEEHQGVTIYGRKVISVATSENQRLANHQHPRWRVCVMALAICGLTVSLATRTFRLTFPQTPTAQSSSAQAMRQHLDRDASTWVPPVPILTTLQAPAFYPPVAPAGPPLPSVLFDQSLSNRPPPSCWSLRPLLQLTTITNSSSVISH